MAIGSLRHQHSKGKFNMFSFRIVCRSVSNHPLLLAVLLFLICLHWYFPFLFSLLVSASPVLICTAVVLGTLLMHGQPNNNGLKYPKEVSNTGATLRTGVGEYHPYSADKEGIYSKDRFTEVRNGIVEKGMRASGTLGSGIRLSGNVTNKADWEYCNVELSKGSKIHEETSKSDFDFADFEKANFQMCMDRDYDKTFKVDQVVGMQDELKSFFGQQNAADTGIRKFRTNNHESSDGESDEAEKSSFDALVADAIPTAQETHPLLDSKDLLHRDASRNAPLPELQSLNSNQSSEDSGEDEHDDDVNVDVDEKLKGKDEGGKLANAWMEKEKNQHLESLVTGPNGENEGEKDVGDDESIEDDDDDGEDDDDDDDEQENKIREPDARNNQVTMWTEEDEKNLRLVGHSELERDLRLENLLARRRAKRNFSMISEKNLIDLDRPISFHVTPISTTRVNPFETPVDTKQQHSDIPPIPGSAPPVRVAGKNPFESPSTSPKGNQNFTEDQILKKEPLETNLNNSVFHEDCSSSTGYNSTRKPKFVEANRKDAVFRRYESFSTGYNIIEENSGHDFMETNRRDAVLRRHETFNTRSEFHSSLYSPGKLANFKMRPFFVPEHMIEDQEARRTSSSHDSESSASSSESESDHTESLSTLANDEDVGFGKDTTAEGDQSNHGPSDSKDTISENSDTEGSLHDDTGEEFAASLEANAEVYADHIYQKASSTHDNATSTTSVTSENDHSSGKKDEGEDETVGEPGLSPKASSNGTIEPPVYDASPSGTEKTTPFSSTHSQV